MNSATDSRIDPRAGFTEMKGAELFIFDKPGVFLQGKLLETDEVEMNGKPVIYYIIETKNGKTWKVHATADLKQKLSLDKAKELLGKIVHIEYEGLDPEVEKGGNKMRRFFVGVK